MGTETKIVLIDGKEVALRASGATPILYRTTFGGDLLAEFSIMSMEAAEGILPDGATEMLSKAAYIMARQADPKEKRSFEEWADQFSFMGLINDLGVVSDMIAGDKTTLEETKKNNDQPSAE